MYQRAKSRHDRLGRFKTKQSRIEQDYEQNKIPNALVFDDLRHPLAHEYSLSCSKRYGAECSRYQAALVRNFRSLNEERFVIGAMGLNKLVDWLALLFNQPRRFR